MFSFPFYEIFQKFLWWAIKAALQCWFLIHLKQQSSIFNCIKISQFWQPECFSQIQQAPGTTSTTLFHDI